MNRQDAKNAKDGQGASHSDAATGAKTKATSEKR